jgi:hypothetical protein
MTDTPTDDQPGFVAEKPEHRHACHSRVHAGELCHLTAK